MKKAFLTLVLFIVSSLFVFAEEISFGPPVITSVERSTDDESRMYVYFDFETVSGGGEKAEVKLFDSEMREIDSKTVGRSRKNEKKTFFKPSSSGTYYIEVLGIRGDEEISSGVYEIVWTYPLFSPVASAVNQGDNTIRLSWNEIKEADGYLVRMNGEEYRTKECEMIFSGLQSGVKYSFSVSSIRKDEIREGETIYKTARETEDRVWTFTRFGQSTKEALNTHDVIDSDELELLLNSCSVTKDGDVS